MDTLGCKSLGIRAGFSISQTETNTITSTKYGLVAFFTDVHTDLYTVFLNTVIR